MRRGQKMSGFHGFSLRLCVSCVCVCMCTQRAMMRFSELELKEKEGGGVCVSASAAGRELADGQRRERVLEHCQHTTKQGDREGE